MGRFQFEITGPVFLQSFLPEIIQKKAIFQETTPILPIPPLRQQILHPKVWSPKTNLTHFIDNATNYANGELSQSRMQQPDNFYRIIGTVVAP